MKEIFSFFLSIFLYKWDFGGRRDLYIYEFNRVEWQITWKFLSGRNLFIELCVGQGFLLFEFSSYLHRKF